MRAIYSFCVNPLNHFAVSGVLLAVVFATFIIPGVWLSIGLASVIVGGVTYCRLKRVPLVGPMFHSEFIRVARYRTYFVIRCVYSLGLLAILLFLTHYPRTSHHSIVQEVYS